MSTRMFLPDSAARNRSATSDAGPNVGPSTLINATSSIDVTALHPASPCPWCTTGGEEVA